MNTVLVYESNVLQLTYRGGVESCRSSDTRSVATTAMNGRGPGPRKAQNGGKSA